ncbi:hypothetical protein HII31_10485 [Pseudocercospora fuligena]|uniref:Uncharacterized protein n=1 Tax=Pseudocercospora fuligena TaxID=685502 RepID=A0A8H6VEC0_9PEZI|nr:hypothetical protein HII31_10485 [Pseudocercospora fuligena]
MSIITINYEPQNNRDNHVSKVKSRSKQCVLDFSHMQRELEGEGAYSGLQLNVRLECLLKVKSRDMD